MQDVRVQVPDNFEALPGRGIRCHIGDRVVAVGNRRLMADEGIDLNEEIETQIQKLECEAKT